MSFSLHDLATLLQIEIATSSSDVENDCSSIAAIVNGAFQNMRDTKGMTQLKNLGTQKAYRESLFQSSPLL